MITLRDLTPAGQDNEPDQRNAKDLTVGDWLAAGMTVADRPSEVVWTSTYRSIPYGEETLIVLRPLGATSVVVRTTVADYPYTLAGDADIEAARAVAERAKFITGLREFADWLDANRWAPIERSGGYIGQARLQVDLHGGNPNGDAATVAQVRDLADRMGVKVQELDDRTDATAEIGSMSYSVIAWHRDGRPVEPKPLVDPDASMEAHYDAETDGRGPHPSWPTEVELKPWESVAPTAVRVAESMDAADPTGLRYTRADDEADEPTAGLALTDRAHEILAIAPVSPARVPMHIGVVDDEADL